MHPNITINISINDGNAAAHRASRCYPVCMCRSYFDSKAVYFAIRPMCHKRGLCVSGGECGPVCAMWHPFGLPSPIRGGGECWQTIAVRPLLPFRALFGKEKPGQCPPKKLGMYRACCLFWGQYAGVILCPKKVMAGGATTRSVFATSPR